jgi:hypothetical protein
MNMHGRRIPLKNHKRKTLRRGDGSAVSYSVPQPKTDPYTKAQESYEQKQQRLSKTFGTDTVPETVNRTTGYYGPESEAFTEDLAQDLAGALTREWRGEWDEEEPTQEEEELTVF